MCKQCNTEFNPTTHFQMLHFLKLARFLFISRAIWYFTSESILLINILTLSLDEIDRFKLQYSSRARTLLPLIGYNLQDMTLFLASQVTLFKLK